MRKILLSLFCTLSIYSVHAQQVFNQNVGIKTSTPQVALDIQNQILLDWNAPASGIKILSASTGGWARGYFFGSKVTPSLTYGGFGALGSGATDSLNYLFIGNTYNTPAIKIFPETKLTTFHGNVGIGTNNPDAKLAVKGNIHAQEVKVDLAVPADYVFQKYYTGNSLLNPSYHFKSLEEIKVFTAKNHHLPDLPSAKEIQKNGLKVGEMNNLLLQKIEELTLHLIEQNEKIEELTHQIEQLKQK
ncbi:hypothetical protein HX001_14785 [Empedobacter brevis]|uniref:Uncharacterized protein n=1 Tax=Empedobacter brevis TaxID=247 RepID=A0AAJ1QGT2_9FLAO|nr:hypothetical protein [Empedobacter brevis]MDM1073753.1 hypothetical protein [Empedobacter brevis]